MARLKNMIGGEATIEMQEAGEIKGDKISWRRKEMRQGKLKGDGGRRKEKMR